MMKTIRSRYFCSFAFAPLLLISTITPSHTSAQELPPAVEPIASPSDDPGPLPPGFRVIPPQAAPSAAPKVLPPGLTSVPGTWTAQGPGPISGGQVEGITNGHVCGAIHTVVTHPTNADIVYIGAVNGGVWKTTNATAAAPTWATTTDAFGSLSISALTFDPLDATGNTVWAGNGRYSSYAQIGGSRSGLLRTTDGGATWTAVDGGGILVGKNISGIVVRGNTILVSVNTGDVAGNTNHGVWRSINGGASFTQMAVGDGTGATGLPAGISHDIVSSPSAPNTVYTNIVIPTTTAARGVYKSNDLGATWTRVSPVAMHTFFTTVTSNIEMSVGNAGNLFVGILESGAPVAIFSTPDGGANWTRMDLPTMPITTATTFTVTGATNATPIVITTSAAHGYSTNNYVEIAGVTGNTAANGIHQITVLTTTTFSLDFSTGNGAYVSGGTARRVTSPNPRGVKGPEEGKPEEISGGQGSIHFSILADPSNAALVYIGGDRQDTPFTNFIGANNFSGQLWRGDTGLAANGLSPSSQWKHLTHSNAIAAIPGGGTSNNSSPHADSRDMAMDVNGSLIEVDDGGIFRRSSPQNNTGSWTSMAGNLQVTEAHSIAYDTVSNIIFTGNQDNGTSVQNTSGGTAYTAVSTADGGDVATSVNPANAAQSIRYSSFQNLGSFRKRIMSNTNTLVTQTFPALTPQGGAPAIIGQFTTPVETNTVNANRIIIGASNGIYESTDQGSTVSRVSTLSPNDALSGGHTMICGGRKNSLDNAEIIYAADGSTILRRAVAAGALTVVAGYAGGTARGIITDPEDHDHLFAIDNNQVFRSIDGGATFTDITGDIPAAAKDFRSLEFIRSGAEWAVVVGTLRGVYAARYSAVTDWGLVGTGMPTVHVWDMDYDAADNLLVVSTLGRGVWRFSNARDIAQEAAPIAVIEPVSATLVAEGFAPANGVIDPGEIVQVSFTLRNSGGVNTTNLVGTLGATGGVLLPSAPQSYGIMNAGGANVSRNFTFHGGAACGSTITASLQAQDGATNLGTFTFNFVVGTPTVAFTQNFDGVTAPALPAGWTSTATGAQAAWVTQAATPDTAPNSAFVPCPSALGRSELVSPIIAITSATARVSFRNNYDLETNFDGGVLEIKIGAGAFADIVTAGGSFVSSGYNGAIPSGNALGARSAWTNTSSGYITTTANLPAAAAGQSIQLRWVCGTDTSVADVGWRIDTVSLTDGLTCIVPVPVGITATSGTPQSTAPGTAFSALLKATVTDINGNPAPGATVTFTAPGAGPSGTFPGALTSVTAVSDFLGVATAPAFTANGIGGPYNVSATVIGIALPATFSLTNTLPQSTVPVASALGSVLTGVFAPNGAGANDATKFAEIIRGGFLAQNGMIAFPGELEIGTGGVTDVPPNSNFKGIWKHNGTLVTRLVRANDAAPETSGALFNMLPDVPAINDEGEVTILASLKPSATSVPPTRAQLDNDTGLWSELGSTGLQILMREDDAVPGVAGMNVGRFGSGCFATAKIDADEGEAAFSIQMKQGSAFPIVWGDTALLRASIMGPAITAVQVVARENAAAPGGETFGALNSSYTDAVRMDAQGGIVFGAFLKPSNNTALFYQPRGGALVRALSTGAAAPGTTTTFRILELPSMGDAGTFAFHAYLNVGGDNPGGTRNDGIWRGTAAGGFTNILRHGDTNALRPGLNLPSAAAKVGNIWGGWLNNQNNGAWRGWVDVNGDGSTTGYPADKLGIFTDISGTMSLLIKSDDPAPGIAGANIVFIDHPVVGGAAQNEFLAFVGTVTGGGTTSANNKGIWRSQTASTPALVARTGDTITTSLGVKTIADLDIPGSNDPEFRQWEQPVMDATGRLIILVTFTDGTTSQVLVP